jgi:heptaprenyl diphosphate synthase
MNSMNNGNLTLSSGSMLPDDLVVRSVERRLDWFLSEDAHRGFPMSLLQAARHLVLAPGAKRVRPLLTARFAALADLSPSATIDVACSVELIHSASLLHDDVVDAGDERRGRPTSNSRWGNEVAVLSGDYLLSQGILMLGPYGAEPVHRAIEVVAEMSRATVAEVSARGRLDLGLEGWREMAVGKTGALFGFCGSAVALIAGDRGLAKSFDEVGRAIGVAFQLADDLEDLVDRGASGCADIRDANPSFPVLWAALRDDGLHEELARLWRGRSVSPVEAHRLADRILGSAAVDATLAEIRQRVDVIESVLATQRRPDVTDTVVAWAHGLAQRPTGKAA